MKQPGVVTFVGVLLAIGAVLNASVGIALIVEQNATALQEVFGVTDANVMVTTGVVELIVAGLLAFVAWAIFSGANWARWAVAIVIGIRVVVAGWWLITHLDGGIHWNANLSIAFGAFILWGLFGNKESSDYFEQGAQEHSSIEQVRIAERGRSPRAGNRPPLGWSPSRDHREQGVAR